MSSKQIQISTDLTYDDFGKEIVVINLENGSYFSLKGSAAELWRAVAAGVSMSELLHDLGSRYRLGDETMLGIRAFFDTCGEDGLLFLESEARDILHGHEPASTGSAEFPRPEVRKFTNMQDILLLDPIHDVDDAGWPNPNVDRK